MKAIALEREWLERAVAEVKARERECGRIHLRARNKKGVRRKSE